MRRSTSYHCKSKGNSNRSCYGVRGPKRVRRSRGDISHPRGARVAMEMQADAERKRKPQVLESEAQDVIARAKATAAGLAVVSEVLIEYGGVEVLPNLIIYTGKSGMSLMLCELLISRVHCWEPQSSLVQAKMEMIQLSEA